MIRTDNLILGAGAAGLGAAHALRSRGEHSLIIEKSETYGGLCGNFEIDGFRFDRFVHFSFTNNPDVRVIFDSSAHEIIKHTPNPYNIYCRQWIKHPAQNNLFPLPQSEKDELIAGFLQRKPANSPIHNYEEWLRVQYGDAFAMRFPMVYTRKYWMHEASDLRTEWVGERMYQPSVEEVISGSKTAETPLTYYTKEMRYPAKGGYKAYLRALGEHADIRYNAEVTRIDPKHKNVVADGEQYHYARLVSSIPLPELIKCISEVPQEVKEACDQLECTSGYHISVALKTKHIPPYLWWYIYDEDILAARVYSPSLKSSDNAPEGCSSLQMEVYCKENAYTEQELVDKTVGKIVEMGLIKEEDIMFTHVGFEKYVNVIFTKPIYHARKTVRDWLAQQGIETIGRFGEWDYLWSDQSLLSGLKIK